MLRAVSRLCNKKPGASSVAPLKEGKEAVEEKSLYSQLRPCVWFFAAIGAWPIQEKHGRIVFRKLSLPFAITVLSWGGTSYVGCYSLLHWVRAVSNAEYFSLKAFYAFFVVVAHTVMVFPLLFWMRLKYITSAFNHSHLFQDSYLRVLGAPVRLQLHSRALSLALLSPVMGFTLTAWSHVVGYVPWNQFPLIEINATYLAAMPAVWRLLADGMGNAASQLRHQLGQVLEDDGWDGQHESVSDIIAHVGVDGAPDGGVGAAEVAVERLRGVRRVWLQLEGAVTLWGRAWAAALAHLCLYGMMATLLAVFGVLVPLLRGQVLTDRQAGLCISMIHNVCNLHLVCTTGYRLRQQVKDAFTKELAKVKFSRRRTNMYEEVIEFLKVIDLQDPCIRLGGYATLDRALIVSWTLIVTTYVVVMLQFLSATGTQ